MADCNNFDELIELRGEVMRQWMVNHAEHSKARSSLKDLLWSLTENV